MPVLRLDDFGSRQKSIDEHGLPPGAGEVDEEGREPLSMRALLDASFWPGVMFKSLRAIRGLNANHNHDLKNIFKGTATLASVTAGPFQDFYAALLAKGMKPSMAHLTLARKIASITLIVWKKGARFDAEYLKRQAA